MSDIDTNIAASNAEPAGFTPASQALIRVFSVLRQIRPGSNLADTTSLSDAGFTSLDMVRIMLDIEAEFDLMIPQDDINPENFMSPASIAALMLRLSSR